MNGREKWLNTRDQKGPRFFASHTINPTHASSWWRDGLSSLVTKVIRGLLFNKAKLMADDKTTGELRNILKACDEAHWGQYPTGERVKRICIEEGAIARMRLLVKEVPHD